MLLLSIHATRAGSARFADMPSGPTAHRHQMCGGGGHTDHADVNAARNIRSRAGAAVNQPEVSEPHLELQVA